MATLMSYTKDSASGTYPEVYYKLTATASSRTASSVKLTFTAYAYLGGSAHWLGTGHTLTAAVKIGSGSWQSWTLKASTASWDGSVVTSSDPKSASSSAITVSVTAAQTSISNIQFRVTHSGGTSSPLSARDVSNMPISAVTTYTISYNANGGSGAPSAGTKYKGETFKISSTKPTRTGYTFSKWNTKADGSGTSYNAGANYTTDSGATLYAIWTEHKLTVNYYSNYATSYNGTYASTNTVDNNNVLVYTVNYYYDNAYSSGLLNYNSGSSVGMIRTGYTATNHWGTTTSGGTTIHHDTAYSTGQALAKALGKDLSSGNASINLYAQWKINTYTVSYNANGGIGAPDNQTKTYGTDLTLSSTIPERASVIVDGIATNYIFKGWATSAIGSPEYEAGDTYITNAAITLYAIWAAVAVGKPSVYVETMTNDSIIIKMIEPEYIDGITFKKWNVRTTYGTQYISGDKLMIKWDKNKTIYAYISAIDSEGFKSPEIEVLCNVRKNGFCVYDKGRWKKMSPYIFRDGQYKRLHGAIYNDNDKWFKYHCRDTELNYASDAAGNIFTDKSGNIFKI